MPDGPGTSVDQGSRRGVFIAVAAVLGAAALFAPARIIYRHNKDVKADANQVVIQNYSFGPNPITVSAGASITFKNADGGSHTVEADDGSFESGVIKAGTSFTKSVDHSFSYHCGIHTYMTAKVVVAESGTNG